MADLITDFLGRLEKTKGDPHAQSAIAAEFTLAALPEAEHQLLREALDAAAVLRWFDTDLLGTVLEIPNDDAQLRFETLKTISFVERYRIGESELRNVHESTRLGWRKKLADESPERFRTLSARASACFAGDQTSTGRIEWIYHLLCGDPESGATELENLSRDWSSRARPEDYYALAAALQELENTHLVDCRARVWTLLIIAWGRNMRGETSQLAGVAQESLRLAQEAEDQPAEAEGQCLLGDVLQTQGKLEAARKAFDEYLAIRQQLADQDPSNAGWQRELAVALSRVGGVLEAQGKLEVAQKAFSEALGILRRLADQDPSNAGWPRELAAVLSRVGGVLQAQGKLEAAQEAFAEDLAISRRLADQDPSNAGWPRELAAVLSRVGGVLQAQGKLEAAQVAFAEDLAISRRLAEQDPSNAGWQRGLGLACLRIARLDAKTGRNDVALPLYEESYRIFAALVEQAPGFVQWVEDKKIVEVELALCRSQLPHPKDKDWLSWFQRLLRFSSR